MSEPIGPGDWVECVKPPRDSRATVVIGGLYQVEEIVSAYGACPSCSNTDGAGILLVGHARHSTGLGFFMSYCHCRFRPIYRKDEKLLERLMRPLPAEPERADA